MRKTFLALMLMAAFMLQAQTTSRIMLGLGGGLSAGTSDGRMKNLCYPMGIFNFGYAVYSQTNDNLMLGFRTGLNAQFNQIGMKAELNEQFYNVDYYGHKMDYTVNGTVKYEQKQANVELPLMFALDAKGFIFNIGTKLIAPVWNEYKQTITDPMVTAYYGDYGVAVVNDVATGILTDEQCNFSGKAKLPSLMFSISVEMGYTWKLKNNNRIGFDFFFDYVPGGVGGSTDNNNQIVEISPIVKDSFQPKAPVTVNSMATSEGYTYQYVNAGVKFVWTFDILHKSRASQETSAE